MDGQSKAENSNVKGSERAQGSQDPAPQARTVVETSAPKQKRRQRCRFFATNKGCREGDRCPFLHDQSRVAADAASIAPAADASAAKAPQAQGDASRSTRNQSQLRPALVVPRPMSKQATQDPRSFQIKQIRTRFNAKEESLPDQGSALTFEMTPSDPDFPFEIDSLKCTIKLPAPLWWGHKPPSLKISNKELERGYQVNVERGFDAIWQKAAQPTLLGAMKELDKKLEQILTAQKTEIIKIIAPVSIPKPHEEPDLPLEPDFTASASSKAKDQSHSARLQMPLHTPEDLAKAQSRRETEVRILENRLGRDPQFARLADGTAFDIPLEPRKRDLLPIELQSIKQVRLYVPLEYNLDPCSIELLGVEGNPVRNVEANFLSRVQKFNEQTLLSHINYLSANMQTMAALPPTNQQPTELLERPSTNTTPAQVHARDGPQAGITENIIDTDKSHVKIISRPPEWSTAIEQDGSSEEEDTSDFSSGDFDSDEAASGSHTEGEGKAAKELDTRSRGVLLSFPHLELFHISLLELQSVHIIVKCERCKDTTTLAAISNNVFADPPEIRSERCHKCAASFTVGFRRDIMHASSIRAGYLDLDGCTPFDLLPSPFVPTCSECMTAHPPVSGVRGDSALAICRECHSKMTFRIPETKFLRLAASMPSTVGALPLKRPKENLGVVAGTELPRTGRCKHYAKSHRWFRFSCCNRVYACDKCHDEAEKDHPQEFANRMICGYCSREQNYRPEDCHFCRKSLVGRRGRGFWEGGKGTRDPKRMSRKDPRKYKRRGKGAVDQARKEK